MSESNNDLPSGKRRQNRLVWRVTNGTIGAVMFGLAYVFSGNIILLFVLGVCGVFAFVNCFAVPAEIKKRRP